ncbi:hypothetical protein N5W20_02155 [Candidatus Kirkpatrickella diaphorinae]|uniref:Uncharacterized protein n=1 Tax=Candidatus Kirkpatrickella diaphorinae TaxID=2984322 RepID=A0ABY6GL16_9PROT|nr:hypothetical protein [Candidatus Kirkpatrickella diaphorinae]UYH51696.1 hypothetical protein N5W20_02155 [Candidatus Kirkpatrickella diaphorinae]
MRILQQQYWLGDQKYFINLRGSEFFTFAPFVFATRIFPQNRAKIVRAARQSRLEGSVGNLF